MKKCFLVVTAALLFCASALAQQVSLRDMVVVVRPVYRASTVKFLTDFSQSLRRDGYTDAADLLKSHAEGGFGSGFVYQYQGESYVITNRHVVAQADYVTIELKREDGSTSEFKKCDVLAIDEELDLAIVRLPSSAKFARTFDFSTSPIRDGDEVYSAGFPGLGKAPSWQLGKGIVSNSVLRLEVLADPAITTIVQHTAQVDPGSSGGPLLRKVGDNYELVGINTWKAAGRENANFAIPAAAIKTFVEGQIERNPGELDKASLQTRMQNFSNALATDYKKILPYVAYDYISSVSVNSFYEIYNAASEQARIDITESFKNGYPIEGVRLGLADAIFNKYGGLKKSLTFSSIGTYAKGSSAAVIFVSEKGSELNTEWVAEQGRWRLNNIRALRFNSLGNNGIATDFGYDALIRLGAGIALNDQEGAVYSFGLGRTIYTFMTYDATLNFGKLNVGQEEVNSLGKLDTVMTKSGYFSADMAFGFQLPIKIESIYLIPYVKGFGGIFFTDEKAGVNYGFIGGSQIAYKLKKQIYLIGGVECKVKYYGSDLDSKIPLRRTPILGMYVGITF